LYRSFKSLCAEERRGRGGVFGRRRLVAQKERGKLPCERTILLFLSAPQQPTSIGKGGKRVGGGAACRSKEKERTPTNDLRYSFIPPGNRGLTRRKREGGEKEEKKGSSSLLSFPRCGGEVTG